MRGQNSREGAGIRLGASPDGRRIVGTCGRGDVGAVPGGPSISLADVVRHLAPASAARGDREPGLSALPGITTSISNYPYGSSHRHCPRGPVLRAGSGRRLCCRVRCWPRDQPCAGGGADSWRIGAGPRRCADGRIRFRPIRSAAFGHACGLPYGDCGRDASRACVDLRGRPSPLNPLGVKGAGEAGVNAAGAAIASAIDRSRFRSRVSSTGCP